MELIDVPLERRRTPDAPVTPSEKGEYRSVVGSLQWLAQQTRIDIAVSVSKAAQRIEKCCVRDLLEVSNICRHVMKTPELDYVSGEASST